MKILVVSLNYFPKIDGAVRATHNQARELVRRGHKVYLVTTSRQEPTEFTRDGIHVKVLKVTQRGRLLRAFMRLWTIRKAVNNLLDSESIDMIYPIGILSLMSSILAQSASRVPVVTSYQGREDDEVYASLIEGNDRFFRNLVRGSIHELMRIAMKMVYRKVSGITFPTKLAQTQFNSYMVSEVDTLKEIIPNGIDCDFFSPKNEASSTPLVLYVGVIIRRKGLESLVRAIALVAKNIPRIRLVLIGNGHFAENLRHLSRELGIGASVKALSGIDDGVLLSYYRKANVFVMPTYVDAFPTAVLEAMSCGKPVISTLNSSPEEVLINTGAGLLVHPGNYHELAEAITQVLSNPELGDRMGEKGRVVVKSKYSINLAGDQLERMLGQVLSTKQSKLAW